MVARGADREDRPQLMHQLIVAGYQRAPDHESLTLLPLTERYNSRVKTIAGVHNVKACAVRSP